MSRVANAVDYQSNSDQPASVGIIRTCQAADSVMSGILNWLRDGAAKLIDSDRDQRVRAASELLQRLLAEQRSQFELQLALARLNVYREDISLVIDHAYRAFVARAWRDAAISEGERKSLNWVQKALQIAPERAKKLEWQVGQDVFRAALGKAIEDGVIAESEIRQLRQIACHLGTDLGGLLRTYFRSEADGLLRGMFASVSSDGIEVEEWDRLIRATASLGLSANDLLDAVRVQAERLIEQTLADAKADGCISAQERKNLEWLLANICRSSELRSYVQTEVDRLLLLESVAAGHLPSVQCDHLGLRAGEILHCEAAATFMRTRHLRRGPVTDSFGGKLLITDCRMIFASNAHAFEVNHRKVLQVEPRRGGFVLNSSGRGSGTYIIHGDYELVALIYRCAVKRVNQTMVESAGGQRSRHIPRDVRQRVWQRYGGRCADCGATDYLEFDHVIPVAKGGSNSDSNVQLLCRRCNLKKSDMI